MQMVLYSETRLVLYSSYSRGVCDWESAGLCFYSPGLKKLALEEDVSV